MTSPRRPNAPTTARPHLKPPIGPGRGLIRELVEATRKNTTSDWNLKESVRAAMRVKVRRLLAKYDDLPDHEEKAIELVLEQAELVAGNEGGA